MIVLSTSKKPAAVASGGTVRLASTSAAAAAAAPARTLRVPSSDRRRPTPPRVRAVAERSLYVHRRPGRHLRTGPSGWEKAGSAGQPASQDGGGREQHQRGSADQRQVRAGEREMRVLRGARRAL